MKNWRFEFPGRCHFGWYCVIWLPLFLSNNTCFVHRFPKGMVEITVATMTRHMSKMVAWRKFKFQIADVILFLSFHTVNAYFQFLSTYFKFTEHF